MSLTLTLSGNTSILTTEYFPPIELNADYVGGLVDFQTYNSIPNIDSRNNYFHIGNIALQIPEGSYEIDDIANFIETTLEKAGKPGKIRLNANNNTLKSEIKSTETIHFDKPQSIGPLLGFSSRKLTPNVLHTSDLPVNIIKVNVIRIECNIISGSYINGVQVHTLHEFSPTVGPGYKIIEVPANVIYLPLNSRRISTLTVKFVDQDGDLINFRGETITIRLHLKPQHAGL